MKFCIISDTHNKHKELTLQPADTIIHCGDFTNSGSEYEIKQFLNWYSNLNQYKHRILIAGNHDWLFETNGLFARSLVPDNIHYLEDSGIELDGIKFYGTPIQKMFCEWAFNRTEETLIKHHKAIPSDTDVLITHEPPHSILDVVINKNEMLGTVSLYNEVINRIKPKLHCFGHIHSGHGIKVTENTTFVNASNLDENYQYQYNPVLIEI